MNIATGEPTTCQSPQTAATAFDREAWLNTAQRTWVTEQRLIARKTLQGPTGPYNEAQARLRLLKQATFIINGCLRRDHDLSAGDFFEAKRLLDRLDGWRAEAELTPNPHPTILRKRAEMELGRHNTLDALVYLDQALKASEELSGSMAQREKLCLRIRRVVALSQLGQHDEAVAEADAVLEAAREVDPTQEAKDMALSHAPGETWEPILIQAYFAACDARVQHVDWDLNEQLSNGFDRLWNEARLTLRTPACWTTPTRVAVVSDDRWSERVPEQVQAIMATA